MLFQRSSVVLIITVSSLSLCLSNPCFFKFFKNIILYHFQAQHTLPPYWVDKVDEVNANLEHIVNKTMQLEDVHRRRLLTFDDNEQQRHEREIDILTKSITVKFQESEKILKRILATGSKPGNTDERVRRNIQRSLATHLQELSGDFRRTQRNYLSKLQKKKKETEGEGFGGSNDDNGLGSEDIDPGFSEYQQEMIRANVDDIDQRDAEIMEIAKSIEDLAIVFKELAVLVIDQGTILDRIDYNMEVAVDRVDEGVVQLERARKYQKASRPIKCIMCLVLIIVILIIMLILKHQGNDVVPSRAGSGSGSTTPPSRMLNFI